MPDHVLARFLSLATALLLSIVVAGEAVAAGWSAPVTVTSSTYGLGGAVGVGNSAVVVAYVGLSECDDPDPCRAVMVRRSTDAGSTWERPVNFGRGGESLAVSALGSAVDIVWANGDPGRLMYSRSADLGATFSTPRALTQDSVGYASADVARGPHGVVAIAYAGRGLRVMVSSDGGRHFGPPMRVTRHADNMGNPVAVGDGVIYVAYIDEAGLLKVRSSRDAGSTWRETLVSDEMASSPWHDFTVAASGNDGYVAFRNRHGSISYRHTADAGVTWSAPFSLGRGDTRIYGAPDLSMQGGVVRAVFRVSGGLFYRESRDGVHWSPAELVTEIGFSGHVGYAGRVVVVYEAMFRNGPIRARSRAP